MSQGAFATMAPDEFLAWEREQFHDRHDYVRGQIFAMAGGSPRHSFLSARAIGILGQSVLGGPCQVHTADLRLGLADDFLVYADAVVCCHPLTFRPNAKDVVTNPVVVVEVLSKSTESYDRGDKLAGYLALPSVRHILLVSQREARVETYTRQADGSFRFEIHGPASALRLEAIDAQLDIDALYSGAFDLPGDG